MIRRVQSRLLSEERFGKVVIALVTLGFLALIAAGFTATWVVIRSEELSRWVTHTQEVERQIGEFATLSERMETGRRGYLLDPTREFRAVYQDIAPRLPAMVQDIAESTADNPRQVQRTARLKYLTAERSRLLERSMDLVDEGNQAAAIATFIYDGSVGYLREIRAIRSEMAAEEARLLALRRADQARNVRLFYWILGLSGLLLLVVAILTIWIIVRYTRDLSQSRNALKGLNENLEGAVRERTMSLQRANDEIQRFAYIVSHDLRSPLVNVMGFTSELDAARKPVTELLDRAESASPAIVTDDARSAIREDLPEAIGFIRTSTHKMDNLINAILNLSRSGRRAITPEPIEMKALLENAAANLKHRSDEVGARISIAAPMPDIVSDRLTLDQVFSNLLENAVKYLKPGREGRIEVRGRAEGGRLIYEVSDNGRGIDPRDHERIFELFRRSGAQDQPGEGIGLAHVRALVYRLGGLIDCESVLDQGATFRLSLPREYRGEEGSAS